MFVDATYNNIFLTLDYEFHKVDSSFLGIKFLSRSVHTLLSKVFIDI